MTSFCTNSARSCNIPSRISTKSGHSTSKSETPILEKRSSWIFYSMKDRRPLPLRLFRRNHGNHLQMDRHYYMDVKHKNTLLMYIHGFYLSMPDSFPVISTSPSIEGSSIYDREDSRLSRPEKRLNSSTENPYALQAIKGFTVRIWEPISTMRPSLQWAISLY